MAMFVDRPVINRTGEGMFPSISLFSVGMTRKEIM